MDISVAWRWCQAPPSNKSRSLSVATQTVTENPEESRSRRELLQRAPHIFFFFKNKNVRFSRRTVWRIIYLCVVSWPKSRVSVNSIGDLFPDRCVFVFSVSWRIHRMRRPRGEVVISGKLLSFVCSRRRVWTGNTRERYFFYRLMKLDIFRRGI